MNLILVVVEFTARRDAVNCRTIAHPVSGGRRQKSKGVSARGRSFLANIVLFSALFCLRLSRGVVACQVVQRLAGQLAYHAHLLAMLHYARGRDEFKVVKEVIGLMLGEEFLFELVAELVDGAF